MAAKFAEVWIKLGLKKEGLDKGVKQTEKTFMGLNQKTLKIAASFAAAGAAAVVAGKQIYALGKRGAMVTQTADSFDYLSKKLGLAPDLLEQLRKASRGTITDMKLMSSTATLLAGTTDEVGKAMGDATPQLMEIAKAANKLNPSLGTTAHMYESLSLGIKRQSPLILDNLGLTIKIGAASKAYAKQIGKTVEQLTAEEKQIALLNATLAAGDNLISQVGGTTDSAADSFAQAETAVANLKDGLSELVYVGIAPAVSGFAGLVQGALDNRDAYAELKIALDAGLITLDEHNQLQWDMIDGVKTTTEVLEVLTEKSKEYEAQTYTTADGMIAEKVAQHELNQRLGEGVTATDNLKSSQINLNDALKAYNDRLIFNLASQDLSTEAAIKLGVEMGFVDEKTLLAIESVNTLTEKYDINNDEVVDLTEMTYGYITALLLEKAAIEGIPDRSAKYVDIYIQVHGLEGARWAKEWKGEVVAPPPSTTQPGGFYSPVTPIDRTPAPGETWDPTPGSRWQHGGSFTVPPGFPGDRFPILASSGERVTVQRKDQQRIGGSMMQGVSKGVRGEYEDTAMDTMRAMQGLIGTAEKTLGISSPSAMFYDIGLAMMKGLERGIDHGKRGVDDALSLVMKGMKETAESGMNDITAEVDYGLRVAGEVVEVGMTDITNTVDAHLSEANSIWNWHMVEAERFVDTGMSSITNTVDAQTRRAGDIVDIGWAGITNTITGHIKVSDSAMKASYDNMLKYWENAQSVFGGPSPYSGQLPDWPTTSPPPPPYTQPPKSGGDYGVPPTPPTYPTDYFGGEGKAEGDYGVLPPPQTSSRQVGSGQFNMTSTHYDPNAYYQTPTGPSTVSVQNTLIINTNAPVESDIPDLLLLRAWASG